MMSFYEENVRDNLRKQQAMTARSDRSMSNTEVLCFVLGWQGGTIHQVAQQLGVTTQLILDADYDMMQWLCRLAQVRRP